MPGSKNDNYFQQIESNSEQIELEEGEHFFDANSHNEDQSSCADSLPQEESSKNQEVAQVIEGKLLQLTSLGPDIKPEGLLTCLFQETGCFASFETRQERNRHIKACFNGVFRTCRHEECLVNSNVEFPSVNAYVQHTNMSHSSTSVQLIGKVSIQFAYNLPRQLLLVNNDHYKVDLVRRIEWKQNESVFKLVLAFITRDIGLAKPLVMLVPMLYSENHFVDDLVDLQIQLKGRNGQLIRPILFPSSSHNVTNGDGQSIFTIAFRSPNEFLHAVNRPGGIIAYSHDDIVRAAFKDDDSTMGCLHIQLDATGFRCSIKRDSGLSENQLALNWDEINLNQDVKRVVLEDWAMSIPSCLTRIIVPQMKWKVDTVFECVHIQAAMSKVIAAVFDDALKTRQEQGIKPNPFPRTAIAIILFPTISSIRAFQQKWRNIATQIGINLFSFESLAHEYLDQLQLYGCDIILMTPGQWGMALRKATAVVFPVIQFNLKYLIVYQPDRLSYAEARQEMNFGFLKIPAELRENIVRVALGEQVTAATTSALRYGFFMEGFNLISMGETASNVVRKMSFCKVLHAKSNTNYLVRLIKEKSQFVKRRWLLLAVRNERRQPGAFDDLVEKICGVFGKRNVTVITKERDVLGNVNFFNAFLTTDNSIIIAPFFILDYEEIKLCNAVMCWSSSSEVQNIRLYNLFFGRNMPLILV